MFVHQDARKKLEKQIQMLSECSEKFSHDPAVLSELTAAIVSAVRARCETVAEDLNLGDFKAPLHKTLDDEIKSLILGVLKEKEEANAPNT